MYLVRTHDVDDGRSVGLCISESSNQLPYSVYSPDIERHVLAAEAMPNVGRNHRVPFKMKLFGETHWMNFMTQVSYDQSACLRLYSTRPPTFCGDPSCPNLGVLSFGRYHL